VRVDGERSPLKSDWGLSEETKRCARVGEIERELWFWVSMERELWFECRGRVGVGVIFHDFPHKKVRKIFSTYFAKLSTKFSYIFFSFFFSPFQTKKIN